MYNWTSKSIGSWSTYVVMPTFTWYLIEDNRYREHQERTSWIEGASRNETAVKHSSLPELSKKEFWCLTPASELKECSARIAEDDGLALSNSDWLVEQVSPDRNVQSRTVEHGSKKKGWSPHHIWEKDLFRYHTRTLN